MKNKIIKDIMSKNITCSTPDASLVDVSRLMLDCDCGEIPLVHSDSDKKVIGVITDRDIVCRTLGVGKNPMGMTARDCMTGKVITVKVNSSIDDCLQLMEEHHIRRIPVVDNSGILCGIVSQADLVKHVDEGRAGKVLHKISTSSDIAPQIIH